MSIRLVRATAVCRRCNRRFSQIDSTEERALRIATEACERHVQTEHDEAAHTDDRAETGVGRG